MYDVTSQVQGHTGHHETELEDFPTIYTRFITKLTRMTQTEEANKTVD
jgi:hypothetical protein